MTSQDPKDPHAQDVVDLASHLIDVTAGQRPELLLDALMAAYVAVAETHHDCTRAASLVCMTTAVRLQKTNGRRPHGTALH